MEPHQGSNPESFALEGEVLTIGTPGSLLALSSSKKKFCPCVWRSCEKQNYTPYEGAHCELKRRANTDRRMLMIKANENTHDNAVQLLNKIFSYQPNLWLGQPSTRSVMEITRVIFIRHLHPPIYAPGLREIQRALSGSKHCWAPGCHPTPHTQLLSPCLCRQHLTNLQKIRMNASKEARWWSMESYWL